MLGTSWARRHALEAVGGTGGGRPGLLRGQRPAGDYDVANDLIRGGSIYAGERRRGRPGGLATTGPGRGTLTGPGRGESWPGARRGRVVDWTAGGAPGAWCRPSQGCDGAVMRPGRRPDWPPQAMEKAARAGWRTTDVSAGALVLARRALRGHGRQHAPRGSPDLENPRRERARPGGRTATAGFEMLRPCAELGGDVRFRWHAESLLNATQLGRRQGLRIARVTRRTGQARGGKHALPHSAVIAGGTDGTPRTSRSILRAAGWLRPAARAAPTIRGPCRGTGTALKDRFTSASGPHRRPLGGPERAHRSLKAPGCAGLGVSVPCLPDGRTFRRGRAFLSTWGPQRRTGLRAVGCHFRKRHRTQIAIGRGYPHQEKSWGTVGPTWLGLGTAPPRAAWTKAHGAAGQGAGFSF